MGLLFISAIVITKKIVVQYYTLRRLAGEDRKTVLPSHPYLTGWPLYHSPYVTGTDNIVSAVMDSKNCHPEYLYQLLNSQNKTNIMYQKFSLSVPRFISDSDKQLFMNNTQNKLLLHMGHAQERHLGKVRILKDVTVDHSMDCSWRRGMQVYNSTSLGNLNNPRVLNYQFVCPLLIPGGNSFQHFLDGALPKLLQALPLLRLCSHQIKLLFAGHPRDKVVLEMISELGLSEDQVVWSGSHIIHADYALDTCTTPPLHPVLTRGARNLFTAESGHGAHTLVMLLTRTRGHNGGRHIKNLLEVVSFLSLRYGENRFRMFRGGYSLKEAADIFSRTRLVIGVHGGAFYNIQFSAVNTAVIEIVPTTQEGRVVPHNLAHTIIWDMAENLELNYWRLPLTPLNNKGDVHLSIEILTQILNVIDEEHNLDIH